MICRTLLKRVLMLSNLSKPKIKMTWFKNSQRTNKVGTTYRLYLECITAILYRRLIVFFLSYFFFSCEKRRDVIFVVTPSMEECDDYKLIWKIDSIIVGEQSDVGKQIYLLNSKKDYTHCESECRYTVHGIISNRKIKEDFTDCGVVYRFTDRKISKN